MGQSEKGHTGIFSDFFGKISAFLVKFRQNFSHLNECQCKNIPKFQKNRRTFIFLPIFHDTSLAVNCTTALLIFADHIGIAVAKS